MGGSIMWNRRNFIRAVAAGSAFVATNPVEALGKEGYRKLIILHTNDIHCHFDAQPESHPRNGGKGGLYRIAAYVKKMREQNPGLLLFDSGDFSQGTPYFNFFSYEVILKLMSEMKYDASTVGNHEFDNGLEEFAGMLKHATFPMVSSNYDFSQTPLSGKVKKNMVLERNGIRVGVYGLGINPEGLVDPSKSGKTVFLDPVETALEQEEYLMKEERCDFIICLSHLGFKYNDKERTSDLQVAGNTYHTNLILGGHTHTFLDKPVKVTNSANKPVMVNQAGWAALLLGQLEFYFERRRKAFFDVSRNHVL